MTSTLRYEDRDELERLLAEGKTTEIRAKANTALHREEGLDLQSMEWIAPLLSLIDRLDEAVPQIAKNTDAQVKRLIAGGNLEAARETLVKFSTSPEAFAESTELLSLQKWVTAQLELTERLDWAPEEFAREHQDIADFISRGEKNRAMALLTAVQAAAPNEPSDKYKKWLKRTVGRLSEMDSEPLANNIGDMPGGSSTPDANEFPEDGIYLKEDKGIYSLVNHKNDLLLSDKVVRRNNSIWYGGESYLDGATYIGEVSTKFNGRIHNSDKWLNRLPPLALVEGVVTYEEDMRYALEEDNILPGRKGQLSYEENMAVLEKLRSDMDMLGKQKWSAKRAGKIVWDNINIGAGIDIITGLTAWNTTPGAIVNRGIEVAKDSVYQKANIRLALIAIHDEVIRFGVVGKRLLHPTNQAAITSIDKKM